MVPEGVLVIQESFLQLCLLPLLLFVALVVVMIFKTIVQVVRKKRSINWYSLLQLKEDIKEQESSNNSANHYLV